MGPNPTIGTACDWVWFNVPHGPQKQVACFMRAYECCKAGKEEVRDAEMLCTCFDDLHLIQLGSMSSYAVCSASQILPTCPMPVCHLPSEPTAMLQDFRRIMLPTPFSGCKGESLVPTSKSGMKVSA